jgi:hypothetical protein
LRFVRIDLFNGGKAEFERFALIDPQQTVFVDGCGLGGESDREEGRE